MAGEIMAKEEYKKTHIGTYRYKCLKTEDGFPIDNEKGNYEPLLSFKKLPEFKSRRWVVSKNFQPVMDRILLDIDCENLNTAFDVTKRIMQDLNDYQEYTNIYFSGSKGFHIEILTAELDIIDTSVKKPMDSCPQYVGFLNYFMDKYPQVDLSLKDVGTRIIRIHHTKHEKTGNFKVLVDINAVLDEILESSKNDKDMVEPKTAILDTDKALLLLDKFNKPIEDKLVKDAEIEAEYVDYKNIDINIISNVFNEVFHKTNINMHTVIGILGAGLNGYVDNAELQEIYRHLCKTTDIEDSNNSEQSFYDAYNNDNIQCNMGALRNAYTDNNLDLSNFNKLSYYLNSKKEKKSYDKFNEIYKKHNEHWFEMLDSELFDYVDNTENIFKGIINCLSALYGYGSRFVVVNGGAEVGKSEFIKTIRKLMPKFKNLGSSTPASIRRQSVYAFDKKIVYLGDKGLKGKSQTAKEEFEGLYEVFGGLITDNEFIRDIVIGDDVVPFILKSDGVCVFYSEPYTNLRVFGAGDQYTTRSTYITVNPIDDGLALFLQDENKPNEFYDVHMDYIRHILKNPIELEISKNVRTKLWQSSRDSMRTAKYLLGLFKAYCQYIQLGNPNISDVEEFLNIFKYQSEISDIEYMVYKKLYNNLNVATEKDLKTKIESDGTVAYDDILLQAKERKEKTFFTAKQVKTYFKQDFKRNKNLKDTIDLIPDILYNLFNAGYIEKLDWQYSNQNVYYVPKNEEMEK